MSNGRPPLSGFTHPGGRRNALRKFLYMGLGVKRWLLVGSAGVGVCSVGLAFVIKNIFDLSLPNFLPWYFEGVVIAVAGVTVILLAAYGLYRSIGPAAPPVPRRRLAGRHDLLQALPGPGPSGRCDWRRHRPLGSLARTQEPHGQHIGHRDCRRRRRKLRPPSRAAWGIATGRLPQLLGRHVGCGGAGA